MNGYEYMARLFKERENSSGIEVKMGTITALPSVLIQVGNKAVLNESHIISLVDLAESVVEDGVRQYKNLNKEVVLLRCEKKFIVLGVVHNEKDN